MSEHKLFTIAKLDTDKRYVFGWANIALTADGETVVDSHKHVIPPDELEEAAYQFSLHYRNMNERHRPAVKGHMIESFVVTKEKLTAMGLAEDALPLGWWVGFHVQNDEVWEAVKSGEYPMFSIEGTCVPVDVD